MNKKSTILILLVSLTLIISYFVPMWSITLDAPQYPEGLGFKIWLNRMTGDLQTINDLNHYIGMKFIEPDSIPELKFMPYLVGIIIFIGLLSSLFRKKWMLYTWTILFIGLCLIGCIDFYLWEYDYGHNLNPNAAIIIEGMTYQPPLIGDKQLLNFTAHSYPDIGGVIIMIGAFIALLASIFEINLSSQKKSVKYSSVSMKAFTSILFIAVVFSSCTHTEEAINYGNEQCVNCKMTISDDRFGAEIITKKGKAYKFDAIECMLAFMNTGSVASNDIEKYLVTDYSQKKILIDAPSASYLACNEISSPMGGNVAGFKEKDDANKYQLQKGGKILSWDQIKQEISIQK